MKKNTFFRSEFYIKQFFIIIVLIFYASTSFSQIDLRNCSYNCGYNNYTLNDVILSLTDVNGIPINNSTCTPGEITKVYILMNYTSNSNASIHYSRLFADLSIDGINMPLHFYLGTVTPGLGQNKIFGPFNWTCGQELILSNILATWKTSESNNPGETYTCESYNSAQCDFSSNIYISKPLAVQFKYYACTASNLTTVYFKSTTNGGKFPYTYAWDFDSDGITDATIANPTHTYNNSTAHSAKLRVTDFNGQTNNYSLPINYPSEITLTADINNLSCSGNDSGAINLSVSGGTPNYKYLWSNDSKTEDIFGLINGIYKVTVTDSNECHKKAVYQISGVDNSKPIVTAPNDYSIDGCAETAIVSLPYSPMETIISLDQFNAVGGIVTDNSSNLILSYIDIKTGICPINITRTFYAKDQCNNIGSDLQKISVFDTTLPTASNPVAITLTGCNRTFPTPNIDLVIDEADNCGSPTVAFVSDSAPITNGCSETTIRTYSITDTCGNSIAVTQNLIRTIDTTLPTASNPVAITLTGCNGTFPTPNIDLVIDEADNCGSPTVAFVSDSAPITNGCSETTIRTYSVTDTCGNSIAVTQNLIRTIDTTLPTASNPIAISLTGCNGSFPTPNIDLVIDEADNCGNPMVAFVGDSAPMVNGCSETTIRTYSVTDTCGNSIAVTQNLIRTIDTTLPTASNPVAITLTGCNGTFPTPNIDLVIDEADNCGSPTVAFVSDSAPMVNGCSETTIRTYSVTDTCGNSIAVTQNLIRTIDTTLPTASNPIAISLTGCNGSFPTPNIDLVIDEADNCGNPMVAFVGDSAPMVNGCSETTIRTYSVTDTCGNSIAVTQNLIRTIDTTLPTASNPVAITLTGCNGTFPTPNIDLVIDEADNCGSPTVAFVGDGAPTVNGCSETTIRTYSVTDTCGNSIAVTQNLIRTIDTTLPTASNPIAITLTGCNGTFPIPNINLVIDEADNCGNPTVAFVGDSAPMANGCSETTIRTYSVTDTCGNSINVNQNLIRTIDTTLPTASNPLAITLTGCNGTFPIPNINLVIDEADNCGNPTVAFVGDSAPMVNGCSETTTRTYSVTDTCGNSINVNQNLIRTIDTTTPTASNPAAITLTGCNGTFPIPNIDLVIDEADNCGNPTVAFVSDSAPIANGCSETTIRTYSITDTCGNSINVNQNLIRTIDTTTPTASNPVAISLTGCNGTFPTPNIDLVIDEADNCGNPTVAFVSDSAPMVNGCSETTIRTYSVTDTCGNSINVNQNLIRTIDTIAPTASNPVAISLIGCNGTFPTPNIDLVIDEADNCGSPTVAFVGDGAPTVNGCSETTIRTYSVTDTCGNSIAVTQNLIRTIDTTLPTASNPIAITLTGCNDTFPTPDVNVVTDEADNCGNPTIAFVSDSAPMVNGCSETTIRTYSVTDTCGNSIAVTQNLIRTIDTTLPTASNPTTITLIGCNGTFPTPNIDLVIDEADNCGNPTVAFVSDSAPITNGCSETTIRTYSVTDACGNSIAVTQNLIRTIDTTIPTASNPTTITLIGCNGTFPAPDVTVVTDEADNCGNPTVAFVGDSAPMVNGCSETTIRTYSVTDTCGNSINVNQNLIRTIDTTLPTASNPIAITLNGCNGTFPAPDVTVVREEADNCGNPTVAFVSDSAPITNDCSETTIRTYSITDTCGNAIEVTQNLIRTIDTTLPTASNPVTITLTGCNDTFPTPNLTVVTDEADNCGSPTVAFVSDSAPMVNGCSETTIRTYSVTDTCGNSINVNQNLIRTNDTTLPTASNPVTISLTGCNDTFPTPNITVVIDEADNCGSPTVAFVSDSAPITNDCSETTIRTYSITDTCGNAIEVTQNLIRTIDTTLPTASNPVTITLTGCNDTFPTPNITVVIDEADNCGNPTVAFVSDSAPIVNGCSETTIRTYSVTDTCGNSIAVTQNLIRTIDTNTPTASNPAAITLTGCNGTFPTPNIDLVIDEADNCGSPTVAFVSDSAPIVNGCSETTIRTYSVTDTCGNSINVNQNLIRTIDTTIPTASNPTTITLIGCNGTFPTPNIDLVIDEADNCGNPTVAFVSDSAPMVNGCSETTIRTYSVTDTCGNTINVNQNLIRTIDTIAPTFSVPGNTTVYTDANCKYEVSVSVTGDVIDEADNCTSELQATYSDSMVSNECQGSKILTRTWSLVDNCGNQAPNQVQTITILDNIAPTFSVPANTTVYTDANCKYEVSVSVTGDVIDEADNCTIELQATYSDSIVSNECEGSKILTRTWSLVDNCGNQAPNQVQTITILDNIAPTFSVPANTTVYTDANCKYEVSVSVTGDVIDEADNCTSELQATYSDSMASNECEGSKLLTRTWSLVDNCGNQAPNQVQTITILDNIAPTFSVPANTTVYTDANCKYEVSVSVTGDVIDEADNCTSELQATYSDSMASNECEGSKLLTRTWSLVDNCGNQAPNQVQTITILDNIAPTFSIPTDTTVFTDANCKYDASVSVTGDVIDEADNCTTELQATYSDSMVSNECQGSKIFTRTWSLVDNCGNQAPNQVQTITILDNIAPTFSVPSNTTVFTDANCKYEVSVSVTGDVIDEADNCTIKLQATYSDSMVSNECEGSKILTRTWSLVDNCGNQAPNQIQTITILDNIAPTFITTVSSELSVACDAIPPAATMVAIDNCGTANVSFVENKIEGTCVSNYTLVRIWTATDLCGNSISTSQKIKVSDSMGPTITSDFEAVLNVNCDAIPPIPEIQFTDNCANLGEIIRPSADVNINQTPNSYAIIREWKASDLCGNSNTYTQTINVTIQNNIVPIASEACNGDNSIINLNDLIPTAYSNTDFGTWKDINSSGGLDENGNFSPFGIPIGEYILEYQNNNPDCPRKIQILMAINTDCIVLGCGNIIVHNAFSPNNDGINEVFIIENIDDIRCYPTNSLEIYNRWGVLIYETQGYDNNTKAFRGISEGRLTVNQSQELPTGTYFYILQYTTSEGRSIKESKYLYLSR